MHLSVHPNWLTRLRVAVGGKKLTNTPIIAVSIWIRLALAFVVVLWCVLADFGDTPFVSDEISPSCLSIACESIEVLKVLYDGLLKVWHYWPGILRGYHLGLM